MLRTLWLFTVTWFSTLRARLRRGPARPTWSFTFEWIVRYLRADWDATSTFGPARLRAHVAARLVPKTFERKLQCRDLELGGVPTRSFRPPQARDGVVLFFHGGSYAYGSAWSSHAELMARLALASGHEVLGVDYRLAPEHRYPAQLQDAAAALEALIARGHSAERVIVAGDSAGGNLALMLQIARRDQQQAQAAATLLLSPWSDLSMPGASFVAHDPFDFGTREVLLRQAHDVAGDLALDDPRLSPVYAALHDLAPTLVVTGSVEIPHDDILTLVARLRAASVATALHVAEDMPHNPAALAGYHAHADAALKEMADFVRETFAKAVSERGALRSPPPSA